MADRPVGLKWNYFDSDVLPAWVAEMDFGLAPPVRSAIIEAIERADTGYPYPAATDAVAEAGSRFWSDRLGWHVGPERVSHAPDVIEGVRRAITHLTRPGSSVILHTPIYFPFFSMVGRAGRETSLVPSRVDDEGRWTIDIDAVDRAFENGAGSIVLCNPWNPVGRSLTEQEVAEVISRAASHGGRVIADEVHSTLVFPEGTHIAAASLDPDTVVTVTSASKAWNIPGLKAAQVVLTNDQDLEFWSSYFTPDKMGVGTFGLIASAAAYSEGVAWLDEVLGRLASKRQLLTQLVEDLLPEARHRPPEATYLAWIDLSRYGWRKPAQHLLENARVAASEGAEFGQGGSGHIRFNFATSDENITEMVERIAALP